MRFMRVRTTPEGVAVVTLDHPTKPVNTLSPPLLEEFESSVEPLLEDADVRAIVLASAKKDFIAGADLDVLLGMDDPAEPEALSRGGNRILSRVAAAKKPVVAAVHGAALGGGYEVILACHYILASDDPKTVVGLPEVMLGLLPAGGGTQRLPRRIGLTRALPLLLTGKRVRARKAHRMGLVDALTTPGGIEQTAVTAALRLAEGTLRTRRRIHRSDRLAARWPFRPFVLSAARRQVRRRTRGNYPAPLAVLECVGIGLSRGMPAGLEAESRHFGELVASRQGKNLIWIFLGMTETKNTSPPVEPHPVRRLGILGGGFMGSGIASVSLGQCPVVVRDISEEQLSRAARTVATGLDKQVRSGALRQVERDLRWSRLELTTATERLAGTDLVVEAVFEDLELKRRVLAEVEGLIAPDTVYASNTSALPIREIAADARHPERVLGMHYFSPVPKMPLLEIIRADATSDQALATALALGQAQGKSCIVVKDRPGFYTTRILSPYLNEAILLLEEGARIEDLDRAMKDFGFPVGPIALLDEVGIDVGAHVARDLGATYAERGLGASDLLPRMFEAGYQGRKNGRGFYRYPESSRKGSKQPNGAVYSEFLENTARRDISRQEIQDRLALIMVNEAAHCLTEQVIMSPRDGDLGAILGLGFPPFRGGPFHHVDTTGAARVVDRLVGLAEEMGTRFGPAPILEQLAESRGSFYS